MVVIQVCVQLDRLNKIVVGLTNNYFLFEWTS